MGVARAFSRPVITGCGNFSSRVLPGRAPRRPRPQSQLVRSTGQSGPRDPPSAPSWIYILGGVCGQVHHLPGQECPPHGPAPPRPSDRPARPLLPPSAPPGHAWGAGPPSSLAPPPGPQSTGQSRRPLCGPGPLPPHFRPPPAPPAPPTPPSQLGRPPRPPAAPPEGGPRGITVRPAGQLARAIPRGRGGEAPASPGPGPRGPGTDAAMSPQSPLP
ncbi:hypothetical protein N7454_000603 [Penicillium verhagenii]|nr:hypothetical protein N7454_000603 [Penicillium verhagenii]